MCAYTLTVCGGVAGCARSLDDNNLGEAAGQAIGAGLQHTPQLQGLS